MIFKTFVTVFFTVFLAEMGDKTQIATMLFAARPDYSPLMVFLAASAALFTASLIGVLAGTLLEGVLPRRLLSIVAGMGFIGIGVVILIKGA